MGFDSLVKTGLGPEEITDGGDRQINRKRGQGGSDCEARIESRQLVAVNGQEGRKKDLINLKEEGLDSHINTLGRPSHHDSWIQTEGRQCFRYLSQHLSKWRNARKHRFAATSETKSTGLRSKRKLPMTRLNSLAAATAIPPTSAFKDRFWHIGLSTDSEGIPREGGVCCIGDALAYSNTLAQGGGRVAQSRGGRAPSSTPDDAFLSGRLLPQPPTHLRKATQ